MSQNKKGVPTNCPQKFKMIILNQKLEYLFIWLKFVEVAFVSFFKEDGGHIDTFAVGAWFHLSNDCNKRLASLEFQGINCLSTDR